MMYRVAGWSNSERSWVPGSGKAGSSSLPTGMLSSLVAESAVGTTASHLLLSYGDSSESERSPFQSLRVESKGDE